jgi:hypothetical protein
MRANSMGRGGAARQRRPPRPLFIKRVTTALRFHFHRGKAALETVRTSSQKGENGDSSTDLIAGLSGARHGAKATDS